MSCDHLVKVLPLRVFCLVADCHADVGYYRRLWDIHFQQGVACAVEKVVFPVGINFSEARQNLDNSSAWISGGRAEMSEKILKQIRTAIEHNQIDLVLSYGYSADVDPAVIQDIIREGIPWVNFFCDSITHFSLVEEISRAVSLCWFPEHAAIDSYRKIGAKVFCAPYAINCEALPEVQVHDPKFDVNFLGLPISNRREVLGLLACAGLKVQIGGHGWLPEASQNLSTAIRAAPVSKRLKRNWQRLPQRIFKRLSRELFGAVTRRHAIGPLADDHLASFLGRGKISLGLNQTTSSDGRALVSYMKFRDLEFPGMGTCYLTQHNEDIEVAYDVGREVETFKSIPELIWKAHALAHRPAKRAQMQKDAAQAVRTQHNWTTRLRQILACLN
jgi:hypothetical protein